MKTHKILNIVHGGYWFECIENEGKEDPYTLYLVWWNQGKHRKQMLKTSSFPEILNRLSIAYKNLEEQK